MLVCCYWYTDTGIFDGIRIALSTHGLGNYELFHDGGSYHIETSPLICSAYLWTGFCMIITSVMKNSIIACFRTGQRCNQSTSKINDDTFDKNS